ncbi:hypothetical protein [Marinospirillum insulare]|uniref:ATPase n=1 Tax=Marinospirillum insulare TaxID=217169 RepID=A0ABQ6A1T3_9GAMM|nr:hypothetical protein [Marinospirillum insulare]GLR65262.1 hypothetical protein GCM10007878_27010 [Marinospirillum insulare]
MPNRKEPRLEIEEVEAAAKPTGERAEATEATKKQSAHASQSEAKPIQEPKPSPEAKPTPETQPIKEKLQATQPASSFKSWLAIGLATAALGVLVWQYTQAQQQQASLGLLADRIQELEIRLSETGEDLSSAGSSFNNQLEETKATINSLISEKSKNNEAHKEIRSAIGKLDSKTQQLNNGLDKLEKQLATSLAASESALAQSKSLASNLKSNTDEFNFHINELNQRLAEISLTTSAFDQRLRDQDQRKQLEALQKQLAQLTTEMNQILPDDLQSKLVEQEEILSSLEASRSQLVSRVTRLMEEVRELQQAK